MDGKKIAFASIFFVLALISLQVNFIPVYGSPGHYLTTFNFFAPIAGGFLGGIVGVIAVLAAEVVNVLIKGTGFDFVTTILLFPILVSVWFFDNHKFETGIVVTAIGVAAWLLNPIGRQVWFYSLLFLVPMAASYFKNIWGRSFGSAYASFVAGQVLWLYLIPTTPADWIGWIPLAIFERTAFSIGIAVSYVLMTTLLARVNLPANLKVDAKYDLVKRLSLGR